MVKDKKNILNRIINNMATMSLHDNSIILSMKQKQLQKDIMQLRATKFDKNED